MGTANFEDFYEVPNLNFDISKLRNDLDEVLKANLIDARKAFRFKEETFNVNPIKKGNLISQVYDFINLEKNFSYYI